jgi:hypothetical protein
MGEEIEEKPRISAASIDEELKMGKENQWSNGR